MSAQAAALVRTWRVGRFSATLTVPPITGGVVEAHIEWTPHLPWELTPDELEAYRLGRDAALAELGLPARVLD